MPDLTFQLPDRTNAPDPIDGGTVVAGGTVTVRLRVANTSGVALDAVTVDAPGPVAGAAFAVGTPGGDMGASLALGTLLAGAAADVWVECRFDAGSPAAALSAPLPARWTKTGTPAAAAIGLAFTGAAFPDPDPDAVSRRTPFVFRNSDSVPTAGAGRAEAVQERVGGWGRLRTRATNPRMEEGGESRLTIADNVILLAPDVPVRERWELRPVGETTRYEVLLTRFYPRSIQCDVRRVA